MRKLICLVSIVFIALGMGCVSNSDITDKPAPAEMNISETPYGKPVVEYSVATPYAADKDEWMKEYAQDHRIGDGEELHLFTFSDGKQFEYWMSAKDASEKGFLYPSSWTEEPDESMAPSKITEGQFNTNLNQLLSKWSGSTFKIVATGNASLDEGLVVYINKPLTGLDPSTAAVCLKNYIDYNPDRNTYALLIETTDATGKTMGKLFAYVPDEYRLYEAETSGGSVTGDEKVWIDTTYTTIVNAIQSNTFTNHPGKTDSR